MDRRDGGCTVVVKYVPQQEENYLLWFNCFFFCSRFVWRCWQNDTVVLLQFWCIVYVVNNGNWALGKGGGGGRVNIVLYAYWRKCLILELAAQVNYERGCCVLAYSTGLNIMNAPFLVYILVCDVKHAYLEAQLWRRHYKCRAMYSTSSFEVVLWQRSSVARFTCNETPVVQYGKTGTWLVPSTHWGVS